MLSAQRQACLFAELWDTLAPSPRACHPAGNASRIGSLRAAVADTPYCSVEVAFWRVQDTIW